MGGVPLNWLFAAPFLIGLLALLRARRRPGPALSGALGRYQRRASRWRTGGLVAGLCAAVCLAYLMNYGSAGIVFGGCTLAGVLIGELRVPRPEGPVRAAVLTPRQVRHYFPRRCTALFAALVVALAVLLTAVVVATRRSAVRDGFVLLTCPNGTAFMLAEQDVSTLVLGALGCVVGGAGVCLLAARRVVTRPALPGAPTPDHALRASSVEAVALAWGCLVASWLLMSSVLTADYLQALREVPCNNRELLAPYILALLAALGSAAGLVHLVIRLTRLPAPNGTAA
ncbi:hypothetical protein [Streptomyces sp. VRA16 Mangrove soil]|uniref:hypothetical protein n=1 Tax=Streptomyces sp. VRA16 Mangrove soil TaxID=2817434 RepID=UPI001A9CE5A8|nr:hypothetical protein [Streptomyces sp. VRA16 Mangrove soil]MBO1336194.1 hypothetical protein [Streptomyces sp. VRA16 Mangrove soil]